MFKRLEGFINTNKIANDLVASTVYTSFILGLSYVIADIMFGKFNIPIVFSVLVIFNYLIYRRDKEFKIEIGKRVSK